VVRGTNDLTQDHTNNTGRCACTAKEVCDRRLGIQDTRPSAEAADHKQDGDP